MNATVFPHRALLAHRLDRAATVDTNVHPTGARGWLAALARTREDTPC